jgi:polysaccharide pyruvyl transferase WcaK-like protein
MEVNFEKFKSLLKKETGYFASMQLGEDLKEAGLELYEPNSALAAFEAFEKAQLAVTMRLHAGIFGVAAGTPVLALSYSQKVKGLLGDSCTVLSGFEPEKLRDSLKTLTKKSHNVEVKLVKNQSFLRQVLEA